MFILGLFPSNTKDFFKVHVNNRPTRVARPFVPLHASHARLLGHFVPSGLALQPSIGYSIASFPLVSRFALAFLVALLPHASCSHLVRFAVCLSTQNALKRIEIIIIIIITKTHIFTPLTHKARAAKRNCAYPMSLPGSQGVSMPSFMSIGPKLWALEGYS